MIELSGHGSEDSRMTDTSYAWRPAATEALRRLTVVTIVGAMTGFLVGGVGGRLIMSLLAGLNTEDAGTLSDDGFRMGQVTLGGTLNLLLVGTVLGVLGGGIYLAVRDLRIGPWWFRAMSLSAGATVVVGAALVHSDGVDFTLLEPTWVAIGLTLAIPGMFALALPPLAERWLRPDSRLMTTRSRLLLLTLIPWAFPLTPAAIVLVLGWLAIRWIPAPPGSHAGTVIRWLGRLALTAVFAFATISLARTIAEIYDVT